MNYNSKHDCVLIFFNWMIFFEIQQNIRKLKNMSVSETEMSSEV